MISHEIQQKLKSIIAPYVQNQANFDKLDEDSDFISDLEINSANLVDVVLDVEEEFDIEISNEDMEKMLNVKASVEIIQRKLSEQT